MRYSDFKIVENVEHLYEADARIQHAEDLIFFQGSKGAIRTLEALKSMEQGGQENVTVKWDGSPAIIFGRNEMENSSSQTNQDLQQKDTTEEQNLRKLYKKCLWPAPEPETQIQKKRKDTLGLPQT